jgi:hypothetical protein
VDVDRDLEILAAVQLAARVALSVGVRDAGPAEAFRKIDERRRTQVCGSEEVVLAQTDACDTTQAPVLSEGGSEQGGNQTGAELDQIRNAIAAPRLAEAQEETVVGDARE